MPTPQQNIARVEALISEIEAHPMCLRLKADRDHYVVLFPAGFRVDGARANSRGVGKAEALRRLLQVMEREWINSYPQSRA